MSDDDFIYFFIGVYIVFFYGDWRCFASGIEAQQKLLIQIKFKNLEC